MKKEPRILDAALTVVRKYTISGTRMHLIADEANMLQSNLHYYYKTKDDLMHALQNKVLEKCLSLRDMIKKEADDSLESQLEVFIEQKKQFILHFREYDYAEVDFWVQGRIHPEMKREFARSFAGWRDGIGEILDKYAPALSVAEKQYFSAIMVSYLEGATIQYLTDEECFDLEEYFAYGKQMLLNALLCKGVVPSENKGDTRNEVDQNTGGSGTCSMS